MRTTAAKVGQWSLNPDHCLSGRAARDLKTMYKKYLFSFLVVGLFSAPFFASAYSLTSIPQNEFGLYIHSPLTVYSAANSLEDLGAASNFNLYGDSNTINYWALAANWYSISAENGMSQQLHSDCFSSSTLAETVDFNVPADSGTIQGIQIIATSSTDPNSCFGTGYYGFVSTKSWWILEDGEPAGRLSLAPNFKSVLMANITNTLSGSGVISLLALILGIPLAFYVIKWFIDLVSKHNEE